MKEKKLKDLHTGAHTLSIRTARGENLDYERAEWLATWPSPVLLRFKYEVKGHSNLFYYDITGLPTLKEYLGMGISRSQYVSLLHSLGRLGDLCSKANLPMEILRFEPENVYVANEGMVFCCLPMTPVVQQMSVLALLALLADPGKVKFVLPADRELTARTMDFVRRSRVFSAFDFNEFLANNFGGVSGLAGVQSSASQDFSARGRSQEAVFDPFSPDAQQSRAGGGSQNDARRQTPFRQSYPNGQQAGGGSGPDVLQPTSGRSYAGPRQASVAPSAGFSLPAQAQTQASAQAESPAQTQDSSRASAQAPSQAQVPAQTQGPSQAQAQTQVHSPAQTAIGVDIHTNRNSVQADSSHDADGETRPSLIRPSSEQVQSPQPHDQTDAENNKADVMMADRPAEPQTPLDSGTRALSGALRPSNPGLAGADSAGRVQATNHMAASAAVGSNGMNDQAAPAGSGFSPQPATSRSFAVVRDRDGSRLCAAVNTVMIGRSKRCAARVVGNTNVSRVHACVTDLGGGRFIVSDLGSANGTTVGGRVLHQGDQAQIGRGEHFSVADESLHLE
ncbi:FHA domain-containing protein [Bifidobacterium sp. ESL0798]|uniref:FHA domain-containing protein n=1 Tax=Bifidobacterium sp. ESL0798 TaxID=2983235 RepID=UPI0023F96619|nr:FHA domain-containing protein [Bifidobacterium sp. ESL0798]WEV73590.1 FHA domain-containing protein [Bifidobacterium sp. ESL0798]